MLFGNFQGNRTLAKAFPLSQLVTKRNSKQEIAFYIKRETHAAQNEFRSLSTIRNDSLPGDGKSKKTDIAHVFVCIVFLSMTYAEVNVELGDLKQNVRYIMQ